MAVQYANPGSESEVEAGESVGDAMPRGGRDGAKPWKRAKVFALLAVVGCALAAAAWRYGRPSTILDAATVDGATSLAEATDGGGAAAPPAKCSGAGADCRKTRCCQQAGTQCFEKNSQWAMCLPSCSPGLHKGDAVKEPWSCRVLWSKEQVQRDWAIARQKAQKTLKGMEGSQKMALIQGSDGGNGYAGFVNMQYIIAGAQA
eukprot:CAMPEP_0115666526 /NCGR_PEP_ID=MMETSP0272-20121206/49460_1 /TAXON_ID=71861 /ORGANISM="Scrippsiella trochoidea, Strain CCMP3099" /LENGTH=202 /DNA_ID=CAMNT_0003105025 /DNA_START=9 /DNA_END=613 /DNA_ORIENTATION=+